MFRIIKLSFMIMFLGTGLTAVGACTPSTTGAGASVGAAAGSANVSAQMTAFLADANAVASKSAQVICQLAPGGNALFQSLALSGKLSPTVIRNEAAAYKAVQSACATDPQGLVGGGIAIVNAYTTFVTALRESKISVSVKPKVAPATASPTT